MREKRLVLFYPDAEYAARFAFYLEKRSGLPVRCRAFSDPSAFREFLREHGADLILLPAGEELLQNLPCADVPTLRFTEKQDSRDDRELPVYRRMEKQVGQISRVLDPAGEAAEDAGAVSAELIAFYSPVHGAGQSVSTILMGMTLSEKGPALLLNLERFPGIRTYFPAGDGSLSELLYYAKVQRDFTAHLKEVTAYFGPLAYIPPAREPEDLLETRPEDWRFLLSALRDSGIYRYILIDVGDGVPKERPILELCEKIYVPIREDEIALNKLLEWQGQLEAQGGGDLLQRLRTYRLPPPAPSALTEYRELKHLSWGRTIKALAEGDA
ncbi:MAG: hypothetical protein J5496_05745 [Lachnospiraceae bacterium]|nr:hypothetical protein [Lachnospiraceae bacterium]